MSFVGKIQRMAYKLTGDKRYVYYEQLLENLKFNRNEMIVHQNKLVRKLVEYAYNESAYYRELMDSRKLKPNDFNCKEDLLLLPPLTKDCIQHNADKIKTKDIFGDTLEEVTSGGSTGNQVTIYKSKYFTEISRAASLRNNVLCGWLPEDKTVWIWGAPYEHQKLKSSFKSRVGILINRRLLINAYRYAKKDFKNWVEDIDSYGPKVIYGYASILLEFSKYLLSNQITLKTISKVVSTTESLKEREVIESAFDCEVYDQYGCREVLAIGIEVEKGCMVVADDVVSLSLDAGGNVLITALHSFGFPLINYQVGDVLQVEDNSGCGDDYPFSVIKVVIGRETDNFITESGVIVSSSALSVYISTFKLPFKEYQLIQLSYRLFELKYIPMKKIKDEDEIKVRMISILDEYFGPCVSLTVLKVKSMPVEKSGKKLLFKRMF